MEVVAGVVVQYFANIFSSGTCNQIEECLEAVPQKLTSDMQQTLSREFNVDEIKTALFQMQLTKAPRPDGMNALFYKKKIWHIVGDIVVYTVLEFLNTSHMLPKLNYTYIVLIPKIKKKNFEEEV